MHSLSQALSNNGKLEMQWHKIMKNFTIHPRAVARQLLASLEDHKTLSPREESRVIHAIESTGVPVDRVLASLSRNTLQALLNEI